MNAKILDYLTLGYLTILINCCCQNLNLLITQ